jgi:hypothetical protein
MKQRRLHSFGEAVFNNIVSFAVAYCINLAVIPTFRRTMTDSQVAFWLTMLFTLVSLVRQYFIRRFFNWWHHRKPEPEPKEFGTLYTTSDPTYRKET